MANGKNNPMLNAYLIVGEDALKRRTVLERLRKRLFGTDSVDFDHDQFNGENASGEDIVTSCNTLPFMSEFRLVEVSNVEKLSKQSSEALVKYLASPFESCVLALSGEKLAKSTRLYKAVAALGKQAVIDCTPLKKVELVKAVRNMAVGYGFTMTPDGCEALVDLVGENTVHIDSELQKLALAGSGNAPLSRRDVERLVARTSEAKPWHLADALSQRSISSCFNVLSKMESASPYNLLAQMTSRIRELICAKTLASRGESARLSETLKVQPWRVKNHVSWARNYEDWELRQALVNARDCEQAMKSGADPDEAFRSWLVKTVAR